MPILLIAATAHEIQEQFSASNGVDILVTGVGCPATIYHLQKRLQQIDYEMVIQAGIAGTFSDAYQPGATVLVGQDVFGDLGTEEKESFTTIFEAGLGDANAFPFEHGWLINSNPLLGQLPLPKVNAVTVNKVSDSLVQKQEFIRLFNPQVESMEGAALHFVCLQEKIPFLQIRSISNKVGERDKSRWKMKEAIDNLNRELAAVLTFISSAANK